MTAPILTIADAIVTALNAATLTQTFTATRVYVPKFDLFSSDAVQVTVVPMSDTREPGTVGGDSADMVIDIGVFKKLQNAVSAETAEVDAMLALCEEIRALINRERLTGATDSICILVEQEPIYSVEEIDGKRTFLTVLSATFRTEVAVT